MAAPSRRRSSIRPRYRSRTGAARAGINEKILRAERKRVAYVIRNGRFVRPEESVQLRTIAIAKEALSTMIASSGVNDTYRMFLLARRDGVGFNLASIGDDFDVPYKGPFNKEYMQTLYDYGYQKGRAGYPLAKSSARLCQLDGSGRSTLESRGGRCYACSFAMKGKGRR